ncbi:MAG TPA: NifU family protein [Gemmataceae bacterium]|nr:NifU family protein [Gemmataceae bacterium]
MSAGDAPGFRERMSGIEALLQEAQQQADPQARARTTAIVQGLLDLHAAALEKILSAIGDASLIAQMARDELVGSVLLLYGLHPLDLETRVRHALDDARPLLQSHGGDVEFLGLAEGVVRLRLLGSCHACPSSGLTLQATIENAILARAPDATRIEVEREAELSVQSVTNAETRFTLPLVHS